MSSQLEKRFQKTSLRKDQTPYFGCEKPGRDAASGSRAQGDSRRKDCHLSELKQGQGQNTGNTQATSGSFEFVTENSPEKGWMGGSTWKMFVLELVTSLDFIASTPKLKNAGAVLPNLPVKHLPALV